MPFVQVKMFEGRSAEQKKQLASAITEAFTKTLGIDAKAVQVVVEEYPKANWCIGGQMATELYRG